MQVCLHVYLLLNVLQLSNFSPLNVCLVARSEAKVQDKMCVHVCKLDKKETLAGKLMWVVVQSLWLLCCVAGCNQAQCDVCSAYDRMTRYRFIQDLICCMDIRTRYSADLL